MLSNGEELPCGMVVWTAGISPAPLVRSLHDVRRDDRSGRLVTDRHFALQFAQSGSQPQFRDVYALGDCASIEGMTLPCTAQIAEREGKFHFLLPFLCRILLTCRDWLCRTLFGAVFNCRW